MIQFFVSILIVISIVLQSFISVAAPIENHQVDIEHIQIEHHHVDDQQLLQKSESSEANENHDISDCHHCNHCNGTHLSWMYIKHTTSDSILASRNVYQYVTEKPQDIFETSFKPPIA